MATPMRVTGAWIQLLTDWLDQENLPAPELRTLLDSRSSADVVPIPLWQDMLAQAVALRPGRPAPGLAIGARIQPRHVGVLGYLLLTCRTLGEAMLAYQRYESLFYGQNLVEVRRGRHRVLLVGGGFHRRVGRHRGRQSGGVSAPSAGDPPLRWRWISFATPSAAACAAHEAFFGCPVRLRNPGPGGVPGASADPPLPHSDPSMRSLLDRQASAMLLALPDSDSFDRALQQAMVRLMPEGKVTLPRLAATLHMSVRTLQRRLAERQLTWRALLDRTREQLGRHYLADPSLTLGDIALLLGFSEHSAFGRAWRQWTGSTPAVARRQLRGLQG